MLTAPLRLPPSGRKSDQAGGRDREMTRRDFEVIAAIIAYEMEGTTERAEAARAFAAGLQHLNPRFDRARFLAKCIRNNERWVYSLSGEIDQIVRKREISL